MLRRKKLWFVLGFVLMLLPSFPQAAWAANESNSYVSAKFQVDVKPEYDDAKDRTLVIYQSDFTNLGSEIIKKGTPVSFIIPKGAEIGMACEINSQGGHDCQPYTEQDIGNNEVKLSWKSTKDIAPNQKYPTYLEFYYNNGSAPPTKTFDYKFSPTYKLETLKINIVAPKAAANFTTSPAADTISQDSDGLKEYSFNYKNEIPKDLINIKVSYDKSDNKPTFDKPQFVSTKINATGGSWLMKPEFWVPLLILAAILAAVIIYAIGHGKDKMESPSDPNLAKKRFRQMLLDGEISEDTYRKLTAELDQKMH